MLSARFLPKSTENWQESTGKNLTNFRPEYCFHVPAISGAFLKDTVTFPHLSCMMLRDPVGEIIDLGCVDDLIMDPSYSLVKHANLIGIIHKVIMIYAVIQLIYFVVLFTYKSYHLILLKRNKLIHGRTHIRLYSTRVNMLQEKLKFRKI